jgi:septal ring-binding cell division protein DamX
MYRDNTAVGVHVVVLGLCILCTFGVAVADAPTDVALSSAGATASASSWGSYSGNDAVPTKAVDGDHGTKWGGTDGAGDWLLITFDRTYRLAELRVDNGYHTLTYRVEVSTDGTSWQTLTDGYESRGDNYIDDSRANVATFPLEGERVRQVRITVLETNAPSSHIWEAIIDEVEAVPASKRTEVTTARTSGETATATATRTTTATPPPTPTATATPVVIPGFGWLVTVSTLLAVVLWVRLAATE